MTRFLESRKTIPSREMILVRPGVGVVVASHDRIAKKNPTMARSPMMAKFVSLDSRRAAPERLNIPRRSLGVMAL